MKKIDKQHNGIGGACSLLATAAATPSSSRRAPLTAAGVRAADQSVKVDNVTYFTSIPTNAGGAFPLASHAADHSRRADS